MAADQDLITFSFRYLDTTKAKFSIGNFGVRHFGLLAERLREICQLDRKGFIALQSTGKAWRVHRIKWSDVSEPSFGLHVTLGADENAWQFSLQKRNGRIAGFLIGTKFFVRWIDQEHNLYPMD